MTLNELGKYNVRIFIPMYAWISRHCYSLFPFQTGVSAKVLKIHWPTGFESLMCLLLAVWPLDGTWTSLICNSLMKMRRKKLATSYVIGSLQKLSELVMQIDWFLSIINCTISVSNIKNARIIMTITIFVSHICILCVHSVMSNSLQPIECNLAASSVHGIFQARILEWVVISSSRGSSQPTDQTCVSYISCTGRQVLYH